MRKDGIIAAQLQPHPLLVDTYGWCQLSLFGELMPGGDVLSAVVPRYERCNETYSKMNLEKTFAPMNDLSPSLKLDYALQMAESIAVLNNFEGGVIVSNGSCCCIAVRSSLDRRSFFSPVSPCLL